MYKVVLTILVILLLAWLVWITIVYVRNQNITIELEELQQGGVPNKYLYDSTKRDSYYEQIVDTNYTYMKCISNNSLQHKQYTFQNELYAFNVNGKWLFKYGVYGGELKTQSDQINRFHAEYDMHGIKEILTTLSNPIKCINGTHIKPDIASIHYTHCYQLDQHTLKEFIHSNGKKMRGYVGREIGAWLHIMEMAGHRALAWYLTHNEDRSRNEYNIASISDTRLKGDATEIIKELINNKDDEFAQLYAAAYPKQKITMKNIKNLIKQRKTSIVTANQESLFSYLLEYGITEAIDDIHIIFSLKTSVEAECFCPIRVINRTTNTYDQPSYCNNRDDITNELLYISNYIVTYQKFICENMYSDNNPCPIQQINVFENKVNNDTFDITNNTLTDIIQIDQRNVNSDISNVDNVNIDMPTIETVDIIEKGKHTKYNVSNDWNAIINKQIKQGVHTNNNGAWDLLARTDGNSLFSNLDGTPL